MGALATTLAVDGLLEGRYELLRELGRGATGRVLLVADQAQQGVQRALKIVPPERAGALRWEFELLSHIAHPSVARVHALLSLDGAAPGVFGEPGSLGLVTDFVQGTASQQAALPLRRDPSQLLPLCLRVAHAAASALAAIHAQGLVHGDVKPDNLLCAADGRATTLIDLDLARPAGHSEEVAGTPNFMAPEVWLGQRGAAGDLFALGVTLEQLLSPAEQSPPTQRDPAHYLAAAMGLSGARVELPPWVPRGLRELVAQLTQPSPEQRPDGARKVAARVAAIALEHGVELDRPLVGAGADEAPTGAERALAVSVLPLAGRARALAELTAALEAGGVVALQGPPGAGRSRLLREAVCALQAARIRAGRPVPALRQVAQLPERALRSEAILHLVDADQADLELAPALLRAAQVEGYPLCLVLEGEGPFEASGREIKLGPLQSEELEPLLQRALGQAGDPQPPALVEAALEVSGGLPGRLCEVVSEAFRRDLDPRLPGTLREVGARLSRGFDLEPAGAELAGLLASAGGHLDWASAAAALQGGEVGEVAAGLLARGLARGDSQHGLVLRPDVAAACRAQLSAGQLARLAERLLGQALSGRGQAFVAAALGQGRRAAEAFRAEAQALRADGKPAAAVQLLTEALPLLPDSDAAVLCVPLADAQRALGRYGAASATLRPCTEPRAVLLRAELARLSGDATGAEQLALEVQQASADQPEVAAGASALRARLALDRGQLDEAMALAQEASGDGTAALRAAEVVGLVTVQRGGFDEACSGLERALPAARSAGDLGAEARLTAVLAWAAQAQQQVAAARAHYSHAFELAEQAGEFHAAASFLVNVGSQQLDAGALGPAVASLREGARRLARLGRERDVARVLHNLGYAAHLMGEDELARSAASQALGAAERGADAAAVLAATLLSAETQLRAGGTQRARAALAQVEERLRAVGPLDRVVFAARAAGLWAALGDLAAAERSLGVADATELPQQGGLPEAECAMAHAELALVRGDTEAAQQAAARGQGLSLRDGTFDARLRAGLLSARAARRAGLLDAGQQHLRAVRSLLDEAARSLSPAERARLRAVDAYREALEAVPAPAAGSEVRVDEARFRRLTTLSKQLMAERRVGRLYDRILDAAIELSGAERGFLVVNDRDGQPRLRAGRGLDRRDLGSDPMSLSRSVVGRVIANGQPLSTVDALRDDRLEASKSVHTLALRSVLAVPLRRGDEVRGAIYVDDRVRPFAFGDQELALLTDLSELASIALESADTLRALRRANRRLSVMRTRLSQTVQAQALQIESLRRTIPQGVTAVDGVIATGAGMQQVLRMVARVAPAEVPVLLLGESGTGKELVARAVHDLSQRAQAPFVSENCGAIPEQLLESTLFGHVKGAFTSADRSRVGLFEAADGGTLFLDEIGEMSRGMQTRLLRVLQDGQVRPVGGERVRQVDVRVVAATHRDLEAMVAEGTFREDLYYRLAVVSVRIPPLRDRREDIAPLVAHFVAKHAPGREVRIARDALALLSAYAFPGNVRQLENEVRRALLLAEDVVEPAHLSPALLAEGDEVPDELDFKAQVNRLERTLIRRALDASAGNQTKAAKALGLSRYGLQKMLKRLDI